MELGTALSPSAHVDRRSVVLRGALLQRRAELRKSWRLLISKECLRSLGSLGPEVESFLSGQGAIHDWRTVAASNWIACDANFSDCLREVALAGEIGYRPLESSPAPLSLADLNKLSGPERFTALCDRYRCPLNIGVASEFELAEELLRQLMVVDRVKLESGADFDADMVLLKLTLVGIRAMIARDLRSLDAQNYFYELPRRSLTRMRATPPFFAFWLCIYAQLPCAPDW